MNYKTPKAKVNAIIQGVLSRSRVPVTLSDCHGQMVSRRLSFAKMAVFLPISGALFLSPFSAIGAVNTGLLYDEFKLTLEEGNRAEGLGPFFYHQVSDSGNTFGLPPVFSRFSTPELDRVEYDIAYPLLTYDRAGTEYRWQLFQLLSFAGGGDQDESQRDRFTLFPFFFLQRSDDSEENYWALFPLYGHLENRLFRSEIDFVAWPVYVKTARRRSASPLESRTFEAPIRRFMSSRRGDITTYNYLFPIFHLRYGDGLKGWQVWPITGHEHKEITFRTNEWADVETTPGHDKRFILWPFYFNERRGIGSPNPEHQQILLPFYNYLRSPDRDSTSYLTPIGVTITDDRKRKYREVDAPWPFVVFARGEGKTANRIWPLFGQARTEYLESNFYLWPLYKYNAVHASPLDRDRTRILFFLFSQVNERNQETGGHKQRTDFWPLYTHKRDFEGNTRLQIFAPLEPFLPANKSIERNYSPIWSIWRAENNPNTGAASGSFFWNLYRSEKTPESRKFSLLFGLFQYQSSSDGKRARLFYLPIGRARSQSQTGRSEAEQTEQLAADDDVHN